MNRFKLLIACWLLSSLVCLIQYSASAQCFNHYTISPNGNICGGSVVLYLSGSQSGVSYQLQVNGANYGSAVNGNGSSISLGTVTSSGSGGGGTFLVLASQYGSSCSPTIVAGAGVYFIPFPGGTVTASSTLVCPNGPVTFTVNPTTTGLYTYQWLLNGTAITNATAATYSTTIAGTYSVRMTDMCGMATLSCPTITSWPSVGQPGAVTGPISRVAGAGTSTYTAGAANNAAAYNWQVSPSLAGSFSGFGSSTTLTWNPDFFGTAIVSVTAAGDCGPSSNPSLLPVSVDLPSSTSYSYVKEIDSRVPNIVSASALAALPFGQKTVTFSYKDQAGRPIQQVMQSATPGGNDMVQPMAYDPVGRSVTSYLPFTVSTTNNGSYVPTPLASQAVYYNPATPGATNIATSTNATSQTAYDNSPLERTVEKGYPGTTWIQGGGHTVTTTYGTNTAYEIADWFVNSNGNGAMYIYTYNAGTLSTIIATDENGNSVTQYTDLNGKMVCKKIQSGPTTYLFTYYVYDDAGNLRYVIPPLPTVPVAVSLPSSFQETDAVFNNFFYGYHYDGRNRLTDKKVPGKGWEYYVYNKLDQEILSQTPTQLALGIWTYTKYDAKGRAVLTGDYTTTASRSTLQSNADAFSSSLLFESFTNSTTNYGYSDVSYPDFTVAASKKVLSVSYYDTYAFLSNSVINPNATVFTAPSVDTILNTPEGLLTGSVSNVLGASSLTYLLTINHYDTYGRTVKTIGQSFISGSTSAGNYDIIQNQYSFTNLLVKSTRAHYLSGALKVTVNTYYGYDLTGRKILLKQQYDTGPTVSLAKYDYNELGQLITKNLQSTNTTGIPASSGFLQHLNYQYNIRGWMTYINNPASTTLSDPAFPAQTDLFAEEIDYDQPSTNSMFSSAAPQYNGNISSMSWQTLPVPGKGMVQELKGYIFNYDNLNRLNSAYYKSPSGNDKYNEVVSYDELGNILTLNRNASATTYLNKLTYNYGSGTQRGNILLSVADNGGTDAYTSTFSYQSTTGNETANTKTGVQQIIYNELNLPSLITFTGGKTISFIYSSSGEEFERIIMQGTAVNEDRSYVHGIEYAGNAIDFIHTEEGRARPSSTGYMLEYQITDHLGNVRALFGDEGNTGVFSATNDIVQATDYYAFGRQIYYFEPNPLFEYKFNGKEYSSDLNEYNYGARYYNPVTARWNGIDNAAEKSRRWSPYTYVNNNPIRNIDPDGQSVGDFGDLIENAVGYGITGQWGYATNPLYNPVESAWDQGIGNFYNFALHLTPFGGLVDFTNSARQGNVGSALLGLGSSFLSFTPTFTSAFEEASLADPGSLIDGVNENGIYNVIDKEETQAYNHNFQQQQTALAVDQYNIGVMQNQTNQLIDFLSPESGIAGSSQGSTTNAIANYYPPNNGALGESTNTYLMPGDLIDRFGSPYGRYLSPTGTPLSMRALPPNANLSIYTQYQVAKPFSVSAATVAPYYGDLGFGTQYLAPLPVNTLLKWGILIPPQ